MGNIFAWVADFAGADELFTYALELDLSEGGLPAGPGNICVDATSSTVFKTLVSCFLIQTASLKGVRFIRLMRVHPMRYE